MNPTATWQANWIIEKPLGKGGQGDTFLVKGVSSEQLGVLKLLRDERKREKKARARMAQEAINLDIVAEAGGRVPRVFENNTSNYKDIDAELSFVMEYVRGESLKTVVQNEGRLSPEKSIEIGIALCDTIALAHASNVLHRDIKPDNLVVTSLDPVDISIVDYGLSFNELSVAEESDLTDTIETIGNRFSDLPERHTPNAKRQRESDTAAICGVIVYCLSGRYPTPLLDAHGNPPHRQFDNEIEKLWPKSAVLPHLFGVLDRGLRYHPADRFSAAEELRDRLRGVPQGARPYISDINTLLAGEARQLRQDSKEVRFGDINDKLKHQLEKLAGRLKSPNASGEFIVDYAFTHLIPRLGVQAIHAFPQGIEEICSGMVIEVALKRSAKARLFMIAAGAQNEELAICYGRSLHKSPLVGRARSIHQINYSAPFAVGGIRRGVAPARPPEPPRIEFGVLEPYSSTGLDFPPADEMLSQLMLSEIANCCAELRGEMKT